ncbi:MAG: isocitrate dehydrogenase, partial [Oscillochloris sp.]|nr:isocitrate dehydrogenase [Oscillochloris sp.]
VLDGDQTGQELLIEALRVLDPAVTKVAIDFQHFDLSLENRRATRNEVVHEAATAMRQSGLGLKAATITPEVAGDVGSPNAIVRKEIDGTVILRTGRRIPGIRPVGGVFAPIAVVRMAVDDAYGASEWREGGDDDSLDQWAYRTEKISRRTCRAVSETAFRYAQRINGKVFGGPKYTVSPIYEGMLKEEMDRAAARHPAVRYSPQLIDATYALLLTASDEPLVIPALNRDGDCLSDLVIQMFGSIAGAESLLMALDDDMHPTVVMAEAPHGTAPGLFRKNVANPLAMILAASAILPYVGSKEAAMASRAITESAFEAIYDGVRTADLGGHCATTEFTDDVIRRVKTKLEIWPTLN